MEKQVYTEQEVAEHNKEGDCWVIVQGKVFDVTNYLTRHPGGKNLIFRSAGQDVTKDFESMFHSGRAREKLKELYVGDIAGFKPPTTLSPWTSNAHAPARFKVPSQTSRGPYGLVGAAVPFPSGRSISATSYTPLTLVSTKSDDSDEECKILTFSLPNNGNVGIKPSQHVKLRVGDCIRSYTPISWKPGSFDLFVKRYDEPAGEMSRYLHNMKTGTDIEVSGPHGTYIWERKRTWVKSLVLVSMGTGITPMIQLLQGVQDNDWSKGKKVEVVLCHASRDVDSILLKKKIDEYKALSGGLLKVKHFLSSEKDRLTPEALQEYIMSAAKNVLDQVLEDNGNGMICVCGTDEFVEQFKHLFKPTKFHAF